MKTNAIVTGPSQTMLDKIGRALVRALPAEHARKCGVLGNADGHVGSGAEDQDGYRR